jgi:hemoglobin-like flavoprotein
MLTPRQKELVQTTWEMVVPIADAAANLFYGRLFELDPALRPMFAKSDMAEQRKKLMTMLTMVVRGMDRLDQLVVGIQQLGKRHAGYGVTDAHYATVGAALLWTLEQGLGEAFTDEVKEAWTATYTLLAGVMQDAARERAA